MWTRWTTRCCSAVALTIVAGATMSAQSAGPRPFPTPKPTSPKELHRTPLSLFPVRAIWTLELNNQITVPPAYDAGHAYFAIEQNRLVAYELATGVRQWIVAANPQMEPAVGDGLLFLIEPELLTALHTADGTIAWQHPFAEQLAVAPVWDNGWLIVATTADEILAFRATDGQLIWRRTIGSAAHARPALAADRVYVPTLDGRVVALRVETGDPVWERTIGGSTNDILVVNERLYVGSKDNYFYCLMTSDGSIDWKWRTGADVIGMPASGEHHVYFVALDNVLRALDLKSGAQLWKVPLTFRPVAGPVEAAATLIVTGLVPPMRAYLATDGKPGGELAASGELAAPPHLFFPDKAPVPVVIAVTRDIAKGATVTALTRNVEPAITPIAPLPNLIPMNPDAAVKKP